MEKKFEIRISEFEIFGLRDLCTSTVRKCAMGIGTGRLHPSYGLIPNGGE